MLNLQVNKPGVCCMCRYAACAGGPGVCCMCRSTNVTYWAAWSKVTFLCSAAIHTLPFHFITCHDMPSFLLLHNKWEGWCYEKSIVIVKGKAWSSCHRCLATSGDGVQCTYVWKVLCQIGHCSLAIWAVSAELPSWWCITSRQERVACNPSMIASASETDWD
jgi:hypothetical protein